MNIVITDTFAIFSNSVRVAAEITLDGSEIFPLTLLATAARHETSISPSLDGMSYQFLADPVNEEVLGTNTIKWHNQIAGPIQVEVKGIRANGFPDDQVMRVDLTIFHSGTSQGVRAAGAAFYKGEGVEGSNPENTGYKAWLTLEEYYVDTGELTGNEKLNTMSDPDYIAPVYDPTSCPLP